MLLRYDGRRDLADFWMYNIRDNMWTCISENTEDDGGMRGALARD